MIWLDEARARAALDLAHAAWQATARSAGAKGALPGWEDPADRLAAAAPAERDPAGRAAQIAAFIAATGGDTDSGG